MKCENKAIFFKANCDSRVLSVDDILLRKAVHDTYLNYVKLNLLIRSLIRRIEHLIGSR